VIETRGLTRRFGAVEAVRELDLNVRAGEVYGFLGPNGAGKTTTIRLLCGLLRPSAGTVHIDGIPFTDDPDGVRARLGLVPDTPPLYDYLTAVEHVGFVASLYGTDPEERQARTDHYFALLGLDDKRDALCKGLSHGMRKKLHIAAILATGPKVLLLDEPTNGLDPKSARNLKDVLRTSAAAGTTVFLSTHLLDTAEEICDRVGILVDGTLRAEGTMAELRERAHGGSSLEAIFLELTETAPATGEVPEGDDARP